MVLVNVETGERQQGKWVYIFSIVEGHNDIGECMAWNAGMPARCIRSPQLTHTCHVKLSSYLTTVFRDVLWWPRWAGVTLEDYFARAMRLRNDVTIAELLACFLGSVLRQGYVATYKSHEQT